MNEQTEIIIHQWVTDKNAPYLQKKYVAESVSATEFIIHVYSYDKILALSAVFECVPVRLRGIDMGELDWVMTLKFKEHGCSSGFVFEWLNALIALRDRLNEALEKFYTP